MIMYNEARDAQFIIEGDLIRGSKSDESLLDLTEDKRKSVCPSSEKSISQGVKSISLGSVAQLQARFDGCLHHFDSADWVLNDVVEPTSADDMVCPKRLLAKMVNKRRKLRANTLFVYHQQCPSTLPRWYKQSRH